MCGRVIAAVLLSLLIPSSLQAQCNLQLRTSDNFRKTAWDAAADGTLVWVATGYGIDLHDGSGRIIDTLALPGETKVVVVRDSVGFVGSGSTIYVVQQLERSLRFVKSVDAGAEINDLLTTTHLFAATSNGIRQFTLHNPFDPQPTNAAMTTTSPDVTSLAVENGSLLAADGDTSIDIFSLAIPSLPQRTGAIETTTPMTSVHVANNFTFASDRLGRVTEVFAGSSKVATLPFGSNAFAAVGPLVIAGGIDRTLRAVDVSLVTRVARRGEWHLPPTDGTNTAIQSVALADGKVFVAAGDAGLTILGDESFAAPYPVVSYADGAASGVAAGAGRAWFTRGSRVIEQRLVSSGISLVEQNGWNVPANSVVRDLRDLRLLTSVGASATLWSIGSTSTVQVYSVTFPAAIVAAVIRQNESVALLADGTLWSTSGAAPQKLASAPVQFISRSGDAIVTGEVRENGTTVLHYFASGDLTAETRAITLPGAAVGSIAIEGTRAAAFTFSGVSSIDLATGNVVTFPQSNHVIPRQLAIADGSILLLDRRSLTVFAANGTLLRTHGLPADAIAVDVAGGIAYIATVEGSAAVAYDSPATELFVPFRNTFYSQVASAHDRLYLFDANGIDIFDTGSGPARHIGAVRNGGLVTFAATDSVLVTIAANLRLAAHSPYGVQLRERLLDEGSDAEVLAAHAVGNAIWISISSGCLSGNCTRRTLVIDPATLATTASMTGSIDDLSTSGTRSFVLTNGPNEIRALDTTDPLHPSVIATRGRGAADSSIAADSSSVYVLGDVVQVYSASTLTPGVSRTVAGSRTATQRIRIDAGCVAIAGRTGSLDFYAAPSFASAGSSALPSGTREIVAGSGMMLVLTKHSLEWWSVAAPKVPARRRAV